MIIVGYGTAAEDRISRSLLSCHLPWERKESDISNAEELRKNDQLFGNRRRKDMARKSTASIWWLTTTICLWRPRWEFPPDLHHLNTSCTHYFNAKTGTVSPLFQGRYRARCWKIHLSSDSRWRRYEIC